MLITKTRKEGNSVVVTLPPYNGKNPKINKEYLVHYDKNGHITLVPKIEDPFKSAKLGEYYFVDEWKVLNSVGREF